MNCTPISSLRNVGRDFPTAGEERLVGHARYYWLFLAEGHLNTAVATNCPGCTAAGSAPAALGSSGTDGKRGGSSSPCPSAFLDPLCRCPPLVIEPHHRPA